MTREQTEAVIAKMRMDDRCKAALLKQCLAGNASAQFVVYAASRKQAN